MGLICGIDEAGKGPLIGDLVIAGCALEDADSIKNLGLKDSKLLTPKEREELFEKVKDKVTFEIVRVSAMEIDTRNKVGCNLNHLECMKMAQIINKIKPEKVIVDCPHPVPEKFKAELLSLLDNKSTEVVAEHKADYNYPIVSAASIIAKVTRDAHIRGLEKDLGLIIGSGYPSDPVTCKLLNDYFEKENLGLKPFIRHTWETYKRQKSEREQKRLFDCL